MLAHSLCVCVCASAYVPLISRNYCCKYQQQTVEYHPTIAAEEKQGALRLWRRCRGFSRGHETLATNASLKSPVALALFTGHHSIISATDEAIHTCARVCEDHILLQQRFLIDTHTKIFCSWHSKQKPTKCKRIRGQTRFGAHLLILTGQSSSEYFRQLLTSDQKNVVVFNLMDSWKMEPRYNDERLDIKHTALDYSLTYQQRTRSIVKTESCRRNARQMTNNLRRCQHETLLTAGGPDAI